jgi:glycosyltransferase involved in cell wall biosynthesis
VRVLTIPAAPGDDSFAYLSRWCDVQTLGHRGPQPCFSNPTEINAPSLDAAFAAAREVLGTGSWDCVVGRNYGGFLWATVLRLLGSVVPVVIYADYNPFHDAIAAAVMLFSQLALPSDRVMSGCTASCRIFERFGLRTVAWYHAGLDLGLFRPLGLPPSELRSRFGLPTTGPLVLFTGRGGEDKSLPVLIEGFRHARAELPDAGLAIATIFDDERAMTRLRASAGSDDRVHFLRDVHGEHLVALYNAASLFVTVSTSRFETFGRSPLEAMACGIPVIVPRYNGFREHVPPECGYQLPVSGAPGHPAVAAGDAGRAIVQALRETDRTRQLVRRGLDHVRRFSAAAAQERTYEVLEEAARSRSREPPQRTRVELDGYPAAIRSLFEAHRGQPLIDMIREAARRGASPWFSAGTQEAYERFIFSGF